MKEYFRAGVVVLFLSAILGTAQVTWALDPCGLITKEEVEACAGERVKGPELKDTKNPLGQKMCLFTTVAFSRLIQISVIRNEDMKPGMRKQGQSAPKIYMDTKKVLNPVEQAPGVGDDAC